MATSPPTPPTPKTPKAAPKAAAKPLSGEEIFKDPQGKWADGTKDSFQGKPKTKQTQADDDFDEDNLSFLDPRSTSSAAQAFKKKYLEGPKKAMTQIQKLTAQLATGGLSVAERAYIKKTIMQAQQSLEKIDKTNKQASADEKKFLTQRAEAMRKLNAIRKYRSENHVENDDPNFNKLENSLKTFAQNVQNAGLSKDAARNTTAALLRVQRALDTLPKELGKQLQLIEEKTEAILETQKEAQEYLEEQHDRFKTFAKDLGMSVLDRMGTKNFNLGSAARLAGRIRGGQTGLQRGYKYAKSYVQARRIAGGGAVPSVGSIGTEAKEDISRKEEKNGEDIAKSVHDYVEEAKRFNTRALFLMGQKQKITGGASTEALSGIGKAVTDGLEALVGGSMFKKLLLSLFGAKTIVPAAAEAAGAGAAGVKGALAAAAVPAAAIASVYGAIKLADAAKASVKKTNPGMVKNYEAAGVEDDMYGSMDPMDMIAKQKTNHSSPLNKLKENHMGQGFVDPRRLDLGKSVSTSSSPLLNADGSSSLITNPSPALSNSTSVGSDSAGPSPGAVGSGGMVKDWLGKTFTKASGVDVDGLNPGLQSSLVAMGSEYFAATGKKLQINSAFRDNAKQAKLYKSMPPGMAAAPGRSMHNYGMAVDIQSDQANDLAKLGLLSKYGFNRPVKGESWHIQPAGSSVAGARAGIYSADAPSKQGGGTGTAVASSASAPSVSDASQVAKDVSAGASSTGSPVASTNSGAKIGGGSSVSVSSVPTFDTSDGLFFAMNLGVM